MTQFTKKKLTGMKCKFIENSNMYIKIFKLMALRQNASKVNIFLKISFTLS